jgi:hypothetical protein
VGTQVYNSGADAITAAFNALRSNQVTDISYQNTDISMSFPLANPLLLVSVGGSFKYSGPVSPEGAVEATVSGAAWGGLSFDISEFFKVTVTLTAQVEAVTSFTITKDETVVQLYAVRPIKPYFAHVLMINAGKISRAIVSGLKAVGEVAGSLSVSERERRFLNDFLNKEWAELVQRARAAPSGQATREQRIAFWKTWSALLKDKSVTPGWFTADGRAGINRVFSRLCRTKVGALLSSTWTAAVSIGSTTGTIADRFGAECAKLLGGDVVQDYDNLEALINANAGLGGVSVADPAVLAPALERIGGKLRVLGNALASPSALRARAEKAEAAVTQAMADLKSSMVEIIRKAGVTIKYTNSVTIGIGATSSRLTPGPLEATITGEFGAGVVAWVNPDKPEGEDFSNMATVKASLSQNVKGGLVIAGSLKADAYFDRKVIKKLYGKDTQLFAGQAQVQVIFPSDLGLGKAATVALLARSPYALTAGLEIYNLGRAAKASLTNQPPTGAAVTPIKQSIVSLSRALANLAIRAAPTTFLAHLAVHKAVLEINYSFLFDTKGFFQVLPSETNIKLAVVSDFTSFLPASMKVFGFGLSPTFLSGVGIQISQSAVESIIEKLKKK